MNTSPLLIPAPARTRPLRSAFQTVVSEHLGRLRQHRAGPRSIYRWQGQIQHESELLLLIKTREAIYSLLETRIRELHPYQTPEIIALPILTGSAPYLDWLVDNTGAPL